MIVSRQVLFDAFGRTLSQRYPITEPKASENANRGFNAGFDTEVAPTTMAYDVLDRNTRTTIPDGSFTTLAYGFGTDRSSDLQFETVVTDANVNAGLKGAVKRTYRNVRELITSVKELNKSGTETIWTSHVYDALKQIVQVVDDKSNTTKVEYDNLGRRTVIDNPDAGRTETRYDLASNVIQKITANLRAQARAIDYNYDFNRLTSISQPNFLGNAVTYTYGTLAAAGDMNGNGAGRITRITSQMGTGAEVRAPGRDGAREEDGGHRHRPDAAQLRDLLQVRHLRAAAADHLPRRRDRHQRLRLGRQPEERRGGQARGHAGPEPPLPLSPQARIRQVRAARLHGAGQRRENRLAVRLIYPYDRGGAVH